MASISPELTEQLKAFGVESWNHFQAVATPEQKASQDARQASYDTEEKKAEELARISADFAACDANGDGRLNEEEFTAFFAKQREQRAREGNDIEPMADSASRCFALLNQISEGDGFTIEDFFAGYGAMRQGMLDLKAAGQ